MRTLAQRALWIPAVVALVACGGFERRRPTADAPTTVSTTEPGAEPSPGSRGHQAGAPESAVAAAASSPESESDGLPPSLALLQGSEDGARTFLMKFVAPNADYVALTSSLRPTTNDYKAMFDAQAAAKVEAGQAKEWNSHKAVIKPKAGQTEIKISSATGTELAKGTGTAKDFPAEYKNVGKHLDPALIFFRFTFVEPGKDTGTAYDGLAFVNGHWVIAPKPWRALEGKGAGSEDEEKPAASAPSKPKPNGKGKGKKH